MKKLLILTSLLISGSLWADDEFPIELTCESGDYIFYFHLNETEESSWWKAHDSSPSGGKLSRFFLSEASKNKKQQNLKKYLVSTSQITFNLKVNHVKSFTINRYSLGFGGAGNYEGQCYKGFKEYEKQI